MLAAVWIVEWGTSSVIFVTARCLREENTFARLWAGQRGGLGPAGIWGRTWRARRKTWRNWRKPAQYEVVIATEVGGGVVPVDPVQRQNREAAGRLACLLAQRADRVIRVFCGLPQALKGELP
ncbi:MAG: bifunctional adenosylcobinamide kinase/adenosylcobinamide-phosphate guanylyltransferase [Evtepia gabavorous]